MVTVTNKLRLSPLTEPGRAALSLGGKDAVPKTLLTNDNLMIKGFSRDCALLRPFEKLLDFYHATEHLSKAADAMYGDRTDLSNTF
jgi:hypothetical protein